MREKFETDIGRLKDKGKAWHKTSPVVNKQKIWSKLTYLRIREVRQRCFVTSPTNSHSVLFSKQITLFLLIVALGHHT